MMSMNGVAIALVILAFSWMPPGEAKGPCLPASSAEAELERIRGIVSERFDSTQPVTGSGDGVRTAEQIRLWDSLAHASRLRDSLPSAPATAVVVVKDKSVCTAAIAAISREYASIAARGGTPWVAKSVLVLQVGDIYIVEDPSDDTIEWRSMFVFTHDFARLKVYFGV